MNRKEQFYKRNTAFSDYETILSANAAAMSFVPWTKAFAFLPSLQATLSKPFKYTGINQWQQRDIGVVSKDGMNINSEALGIKNGMSDMNNDSGIYVGDAQQDQYKSKHERDNAAYKLVNDVASVAGGTISSISSIATQAGSKTADVAAKGIEQGSELAATEAIKATSKQGIEQGVNIIDKVPYVPSKQINTNSIFQTRNIEMPSEINNIPTKKNGIFSNMFKSKEASLSNNSGNNMGSKYDIIKNTYDYYRKGNYGKAFQTLTGKSEYTIEDIQKAVKIMSEVKQAKEEIKEDVEQYKNNYL